MRSAPAGRRHVSRLGSLLACLMLLLLVAAPATATAAPSPSDGPIAGVDGVLLSAGYRHTCGVRTDGFAECWGHNGSGRSSPPADVTFTSISAGYRHTCGVRTDGFAECWGDDRDGQSTAPADVAFTSISAGIYHTCGVRTDGTAECWGSNSDGRSYVGQATPPAGTCTAISAGGRHTCGVRTDGFAECWGNDRDGQSSAPDGVTFTSISAGNRHTCGVRTDGFAECWGSNSDGRSYVGQSTPPAGTFTSISAGGRHTCGVRTDGFAECWGSDYDGQSSAPGGVTFTSISAGGFHTCGVRTDGFAECWGDDYFGQSPAPDGLVFGDRTGPSIVSSRSPAPNDAGWHNGPVTISYVCTDGWSGVASCPAPVTVDTDGADQDVSATGSDRAGNTTTVRDVISIDSAAPVLVGMSVDLMVEAAGPSGTTVDFAVPTVTDSVDSDPVVACDRASGSTFPIGVTTVECTAIDSVGNSSTATFDVTVDEVAVAEVAATFDVAEVMVVDTVRPSLVFSDELTSRGSVTATGVDGAVVGYAAPVSDDPDATVSCDRASGSMFPVGVTTVMCTATDSVGNVTIAGFDVEVAAAELAATGVGSVPTGAGALLLLAGGGLLLVRTRRTRVIG
jgi:hypothetical protein